MHTLFRQLGKSLHHHCRSQYCCVKHLRAMASSTAGSGDDRPSGSQQHTKPSNRLAKERSPYLLQHATNPVNWYPWGEEAFKAATQENKLIFLSVGYSTCHWCHVMERESFEDDKVAKVMNKYFINIKVDREERPDVDKVYMSFVTSMSGSGGWPMSVWLTPDLHPVYGGTYFPPNNRYFGRPGFTTLLEALAKQWATDESKVRKSGTEIVSVLEKNLSLPKAESDNLPPADKTSAKCLSQLARSYEPEFGGFSEAPKFPQPCNLNFLFTYYLLHPHLDASKKGRDMALHTLTMMAQGGIHDHIAQGFARYSTDKSWHVPHFEKMLYDQAQLVHSYLDAFLVTRNQEYVDVVRDILEYVIRDLSHESGGFYSAEDADSLPAADSAEKKEGAFCVWTHEEVHSLLSGMVVDGGSSDSVTVADLFCQHYSVVESGNVDPFKDPHDELKNQNVLMEHGTLEETAQEFGLSITEVTAALGKARKKLYEFRQTRPRPHLDDKMLTAWNGMMLSAISRAGVVLAEPRYTERAVAAGRFLLQHLASADGSRLYRAAYRGEQDQVTLGHHHIEGFCDDYAWAVRGLLGLYEATLDQGHLMAALQLQGTQDTLFWDTVNGGYYGTQGTDATILLRMKDDHDGAEPSVNSVSAGNLLRLSRLLEKPELLAKCHAILRLFAERLTKVPIALPELAAVLLMAEGRTSQVILSGDPSSKAMKELLTVVHNFPHPNRVLMVAPPDQQAPLYAHHPSLQHYIPKPSSTDDSNSSATHEASYKDTTTTASTGEPTATSSVTTEDASKTSQNTRSGCDGGQVQVAAKAFVCHNFVCSLPMTKPEQLRQNLAKAFKDAVAAESN